MTLQTAQTVTQPPVSPHAGRYFRAMAEFVGFDPSDIDAIRQSAPVIEKNMPEIVGSFYAHLLRYPPTRKFFLKKDGAIDQEYLELRMRHLTAFWLRTATGVYDDEYACYLEYVGRAHTARGANPGIYIAERYVIGQVGFIQHAISTILIKELREVDATLAERAVEAWDKLLMVILEMLTRAYDDERDIEPFEALAHVDRGAVKQMAAAVSARHQNGNQNGNHAPSKTVLVARADEIADGCRKLIEVDGTSIGVFHHNGGWYAVRNYCLHRGGPVATGTLEGDTLVCPWHQFKYNVTTGQLLVDPNVCLDTYPVTVNDGNVYLTIPLAQPEQGSEEPRPLAENELRADALVPGQMKRVKVDGKEVAVYNVAGEFYATQNDCTHVGGPLNQGTLEDNIVTCPWHGSCFDVKNGSVQCGPATKPLTTYRVTVAGDRLRVTQ
jgi:nitrite reductase/ring-hydroxylating ferredoxin subunit/hemoglobin-like flavoprotein